MFDIWFNCSVFVLLVRISFWRAVVWFFGRVCFFSSSQLFSVWVGATLVLSSSTLRRLCSSSWVSSVLFLSCFLLQLCVLELIERWLLSNSSDSIIRREMGSPREVYKELAAGLQCSLGSVVRLFTFNGTDNNYTFVTTNRPSEYPSQSSFFLCLVFQRCCSLRRLKSLGYFMPCRIFDLERRKVFAWIARTIARRREQRISRILRITVL